MKSTIEKIRKMLALAQSSNPHEAANAAAKARKLLLQHNLTMEEVQQKEESVQGRLWAQGLSEATWRVYLVGTVAEYFFCQLVTTGSGCWYIVGKEDNAASTKIMLDYLLESLEKAVKEKDHQRDEEARQRREMFEAYGFAELAGRVDHQPSYTWAEDFRLGWSVAVCKRILDLRQKDTEEERALVLKEDQEVVDFLKRIGAQTKDAPKPDMVSRRAYEEGAALGRNIPLNTQLEG